MATNTAQPSPQADERQHFTSAPSGDYLEITITVKNGMPDNENSIVSPIRILLRLLNDKCDELLGLVREAERDGDPEMADGIFDEYTALDDMRQDISFELCKADRARAEKGGRRS